MNVRASAAIAATLALGLAGCGGMMGKKSSSERSQSPVASAQERSTQELEKATEAQAKATEQAERAAEARREVQQAQAEVQQAQQKLTRAQEKAQREQEKAQQLQQEANQQTQSASRQAQQSQQQASQALSRQGELAASGQQSVTGQVLRVDDQQLELQPQGGEKLTLKLTPETQIQIDGRQARATELLQGQDARVAYQVSGQEPTAVLIQVSTGMPMGTGSTGSAGTGETTPGTVSDDAGGTPQPSPDPGSNPTTRP